MKDSEQDAPLYVRWEPENTPFALEIRLDAIGRIQQQTVGAVAEGIEVGGVLLGRAIHGSAPILRIEEATPIVRSPEDGPIFMLEPREHDRFLTTRWDAKAHGLQAVGFYRTHVRTGPLRLSLADRTLVTGHFTKESMAVLLVQAKAPHGAALFAGPAARLPNEPSVPEFNLDEGAFRSLPELDDKPARRSVARRSGSLLFWTACLVVLLAVSVAVYKWRSGLAVATRPPGSLALQAIGSSMVTVQWNRVSDPVKNAVAGRLTIVDGTERKDLALTPDVLRLGVVEYQPKGRRLSIDLTLQMPDSTAVTQAVAWAPAK